MDEVMGFLERFGALLVTIVTVIGGYFGWRSTRNKSTQMLYDQVEKMRQSQILLTDENLSTAKKLAQLTLILEALEQECPECYNKCIQQYGSPIVHKG